jgi:hypothetical protein
MPYNDTILWPYKEDIDFPNLKNNETGVIGENERVYAAHYNKVANFLVKGYELFTATQTATGDGSIQKLSAPLTITVPLVDVLKADAYKIFTNPIVKAPGNVLPFEFTITYATDSYQSLKAKGGDAFVKQASNLANFKKLFGGIDPAANMCTVTAQLVGKPDNLFKPGIPAPQGYVVTCTAKIIANTILLHGYIIDQKLSPSSSINGRGPNKWRELSTFSPYLKLSIIAMSA